MSDAAKRLLKLFLRLSVTAILLWIVLKKTDFAEFGQLIGTAKLQFLIVVWILTLLVFWLFSLKMQLILKKQNCDVAVSKIFAASSAAMLYSLVMPGVLSSGVKWYILKHHTSKGSNVLSSMVYNQTTEIITTIFLGLAAVIATNPSGGRMLPVICGLIMIVIAAGCVLLLNKSSAKKLIPIAGNCIKPLPEKFRGQAEKIIAQIIVFQAAGWRFHLQATAITVIAILLTAVIYIFAAKSAGINAPAVTFVWQSAAVYLLSRLPISIANLGVREFTMVEFLAIYGVGAPTALLMSMIIFSCTLLMALLGAAYQLSWSMTPKK